MSDNMLDSERFHPRNVFMYDEDELITCTERNPMSKFDKILQSSWNNAMSDGRFNYQIGDLRTKVLSDKYGFIVQLNVKRATERRKPFPFSKISEPFNNELFNFKKISEKEVLFELQPKHWINSGKSECNQKNLPVHLMIINVSPLEYCHSLLVPFIYDDCPQVLTIDCLKLAMETSLLSSNPSLRLGFNSLGAFASINHLHFHLYYLREHLFIETAPVDHLAGECYEIKSFPAEGFAFQLTNTDVSEVASAIMKLISYLQKNSIAHNVFITRGSVFKQVAETEKSNCEAVRIFVWARYFYDGAKDDFTFNPAVCELAGHIPVKSETFYDEMTENDVASVIQNACHDIFNEIHDEVKHLFL